jgi:hypothetical protein
MTPPLFVKPCHDGFVAGAVAVNLGTPELGPRLRQTEEAAVMAMPEAAMHEYRSLKCRKCHVRFAGNVFRVQRVTKSGPVQRLSQDELGTRILAAYAGHHTAPRGGVYDVRHAFRLG